MASLLATAVTAALAFSASAQSPAGAPETNGLSPRTATYYVNDPTNGVINGDSEAEAVTIAKNGNVMVGWEDDGSGIQDIEDVWTMFDSNGNWITPLTVFTPIVTSYGGSTPATNKFISYFRADGSATPGYVAWGPKLHANLFGDGIGNGANADGLLMPGEVAAYAGYAPGAVDYGNFPAVQLLDNFGAKQSEILAGVSEAYDTSDTGSVRIGDWEWLSNGNIVIFGDSRQNNDLINLYGGTNAGNHTIYRILTPSGTVVKAESLANDTPVPSSMWHGAGVTANGFAVRFSDNFRGTVVRLFDNSGNPTSSDLVLATLVDPRAGGGGRGDGMGFHGNGRDVYVHAAGYAAGSPVTNDVWVTVLNANGTVRWSRQVFDDLTLASVDRGDCAVNEKGEVIVVFGAKVDPSLPLSAIGRRFDAAGNPVGGSFYISEKEVPDLSNPPSGDATYARVAWRNGLIAVVWRTKNDPGNPFVNTVAVRLFADPILSVAQSGNIVTVSWPLSVTGFTLQSSPTLAPTAWSPVATINNSVTFTNPSGTKFFRLKD